MLSFFCHPYAENVEVRVFVNCELRVPLDLVLLEEVSANDFSVDKSLVKFVRNIDDFICHWIPCLFNEC